MVWRQAAREADEAGMDVLQRDDLTFPRSLPEFQRLFPDDTACAAYLEKARWGDGFVCPHCQTAGEPFRFTSQPGVAAALPAAQDAGPAGEAERLSRCLATGADEPVTPLRLLQVGGTGRIVREKSLELGKRPRKRKVIALQNIHPRFVRLPSRLTPHHTYSGCG